MRKSSIDLYSGSFLDITDDVEDEQDPDPMANMANLVDVMLVFACGLMLALITYWQLDLPDVNQIVQQEKLTEIEDVEVNDKTLSVNGNNYSERGTVYEDTDTGKMYLLSEEDSGSK